MNKIHKLIMLPSNNENRIESHIYKFIGEPNSLMDKRVKGQLIYTASPNKKEYDAYNLYVLSDETPKAKDYFEVNNTIHKCIGLHKVSGDIESNNGLCYDISKCKKVIATTDKSLVIKYDERFTDVIVNGKSSNTQLPQIPQSFVEHFITEYNKGNIITEVFIEYEQAYEDFLENEEFILRPTHSFIKVNQDNTINIKTIGTKLYTKDEVDTLVKNAIEFGGDIEAKLFKRDYNLTALEDFYINYNNHE